MTTQEISLLNEKTEENSSVASGDTLIEEKAPPAEEKPEEKAGETDATSTDDKSDEKTKAEGAPEKYEDFKLPEGVVLNTALMEKFLPIAKELNLTQEKAQQLVDLQSEVVQQMAKEQAEAWTAMHNEWKEQSRTDKEFGGAKLNENLSVMKKALDKFGSDELREVLNYTGLGSHRAFLRFAYKVGQEMKEAGMVVAGNPAGTEVSPAKRLFPNMN